MTNETYLLFVAAFSIGLLLTLIMKLKVHAFTALVIVSIVTAVASGIPIADIMPTLMGSFGGTLGAVALLVGLGCMIGKILELTGGADVLASVLIKTFGEKNAPFALGVASLLFGFPIFLDAGFVVMIPIIFSVAKRLGGSIVKYGIPVAGGFGVMHVFAPPHPGPVASAELLGANIGLLTLVGVLVAIPTWYIGCFLLSKWIDRNGNFPSFEADKSESQKEQLNDLPSFKTVIGILLLPLALIFLETGLGTLSVIGQVDPTASWVVVARLLGQTPIALLITLIVCLLLFYKQQSMVKLTETCEKALAPICSVLLVTGAGGMFGGVLRASGIGDVIANMLSDTGLPIIASAFIVATILRVAQGSATVALTTTSALISPMVMGNPDLSELHVCFIVVAIAAGSAVLSHFNDSGFWLIGRLLGLNEKQTLQSWTLMITVVGLFAFSIAFIFSLIV